MVEVGKGASAPALSAHEVRCRAIEDAAEGCDYSVCYGEQSDAYRAAQEGFRRRVSERHDANEPARCMTPANQSTGGSATRRQENVMTEVTIKADPWVLETASEILRTYMGRGPSSDRVSIEVIADALHLAAANALHEQRFPTKAEVAAWSNVPRRP